MTVNAMVFSNIQLYMYYCQLNYLEKNVHVTTLIIMFYHWQKLPHWPRDNKWEISVLNFVKLSNFCFRFDLKHDKFAFKIKFSSLILS